MSELKPGDKVYIIAEYISDETDCVRVNIKTYRQPEYGVDMFIPLSSIHRDHTKELERLLIYRCDLCDERTYEHSCYKVWHGGGKIVEFVGYMSSKWNETKNGRIICNECVKVIQKMGARP